MPKRKGHGLPIKVKVIKMEIEADKDNVILIEALKNLRYAKKSIAFTVKVQPSLSKILKQKGPKWVREILVQALEEEAHP